MGKNIYFYVTALVAVLILLVLAFIAFNTDFSPYKYSVSRNGLEFVSNSGQPPDILDALKQHETFIISPQFVASGPENSYMTSSITIMSAVLIDKAKDVIIVARVLDGKGNLVKCQSNLGDVKTNKELSPEECGNIINDSANARVFISFPPKGISSPRVLLEDGKATIVPNSFEGVSGASYVFMESLYEDTPQIIERVNLVVSKLK
ncbi:MAG: hypothetical protein AABW99_04865 [archaeon]